MVEIPCQKVYLCAGTNLVAAGYLECDRTHLVFAREDYRENGYPLFMKWYRMEGLEEIRLKLHGSFLEARVDGKPTEIGS